MTKTIEFSDAAETQNLISPWAPPKRNTFDSRVLIPDYQERRLRCSEGVTWFRILPSIKPSAYDWCMPLHVLNFPTGRLVHPRTLKSNARSVFDHAYKWLREHNPGALYSTANKSGIRLLTDPLCLFWVLVEENGKTFARIVQASGYDGTRGGAPGLGHEIWKATQELDETGAPVADVIGINAGRLVCVEKTQAKSAKFATYSVRVGRQPAPLAPLMGKMDPEEREVLTPIENVVHVPSADEEWEFLAKVMAQEHVDTIRASLT